MDCKLRILLVVTLLMTCLTSQVWAKETEFEFYYQKIEDVVQINNPDPQGWWEKTKTFAKTVWNGAKSLWEKGVTRNFFPGEGEKTWYSGEDKNIAYKVQRVKVRDEAHLLELMGAKDDESKLTNGQKALLATYRHSKSEAIKARMALSTRNKVKVILSDTTGFDDTKKYPNVEKDFWPYSSGFMIQFNSQHYNYSGSEANAQSTFVHEFAHTLDSTISEIWKPYGPDGSHYCNELTKSRVSFVEGWAEFNQMIDSEAKERYTKNACKSIMIEESKGKYKTVAPTDLTGMDLTRVEGINAIIMFRLAKETSGGLEKVYNSFKGSNVPWRSLKTFLRDFVKKNPADAATVAKILDEETYHKLSNAEIIHLCGNADGISSFLATRSEPKQNASAAAPLPRANIIKVTPLIPVTVKGLGKSPFDFNDSEPME